MRLSLGVLLLVGLALLAPTVAPYDPTLSLANPLEPPDAAHLLGTDDIGHDVLSAWLAGARASVLVAIGVTGLATAVAWSLGMVAGLSRRAEGPVLALTDLLLALPPLPLYIVVLTLVGPRQPHVVLTLGLLSWPAFCRVVRAQVIATRGAPHVEAARGLGATWARIAWAHVLPGTLDLLPANLVVTVRLAVFAEATLGFLGLGDPTVTTWGASLGLAFANPLLFSTPAWTWLVVPPALGIALLVLSSAWLGTRLETRPVQRAASPAAKDASYRAANSGERAFSRSWLMRPLRWT
jgi:ABC-type dipeptide/oligopeptide/nickel transport system permease subunit